MEILKNFAEKLKEKLRNADQSDLVRETNFYANGDTETGFYGDQVVDMEELDRQIDELVAEFKEKNQPAG